MKEEGLVPIPSKEVPETIDEAFKVQELDASIIVLVAEPPAFEQATEMYLSALACEELNEDIEGKKQRRLTNTELGKVTVDVTRIMAWTMVGWLALVGLIVIAYMVGIYIGVTLLPTEALLAVIATALIPTTITAIGKLIADFRKANSN